MIRVNAEGYKQDHTESHDNNIHKAERVKSKGNQRKILLGALGKFPIGNLYDSSMIERCGFVRAFCCSTYPHYTDPQNGVGQYSSAVNSAGVGM